MPPLSRRNAPKLLRSVGNKPHAGPDDHDADVRRLGQTADPSGRANGKQAAAEVDREEDIYAEPMSSGDEESAAVRLSPPPAAAGKMLGKDASRRGAACMKRKKKAIQVPKRGVYAAGRGIREAAGEDKENSQQKSPDWIGGKETSSLSGHREMDGAIYFAMGDTPPKNQKTKNVHAKPVTFRKTFAKNKSSVPSKIPKETDLSHIDHLDTALSNVLDAHEKYVECTTDEESSSPAPKRQRKTQRLPENYKTTSDPATKEPKKASPRKVRRLPAGYTTSSNPTLNGSQTSVQSSQPTALSDYDEDEQLVKLKQDLQDKDSICALCQEEVDAQEQRAFWLEHANRTVRDQILFCKEHKKSAAQKQYAEHGFPSIDWAGLPRKIRSFRTDLIAILRNDTEEESRYRQKHAGRLVSGKAAALPSKRRVRKAQGVEKEAEAEAEDEAALDAMGATASATGYYGPRGKRVMMEVMTADLSDVIREVAVKDPVVGRSGFAMFLQAVLVPELTLMLVMQDMGVSKEKAERIVAESGELGSLLHEGIGDEVRVLSEDENEDGDWA